MTKLNKIKDLIKSLADLQGISGEWSINYELNIDEDLCKELANLQVELELLSRSVAESDLVTAKCALVMVRLHALNLSNLFLDIFEDVEKVGWSDEATLPNVPEGYEVPERYNYAKK